MKGTVRDMGEHRAPCVLSFYLGLPSVAGGKETHWCFTTNMTQELELAAGSKKKGWKKNTCIVSTGLYCF